MFFLVTEAETRQKLLRNVKKEVRCILYLSRLLAVVFTAAVRAWFDGVEARLHQGPLIINRSIS